MSSDGKNKINKYGMLGQNTTKCDVTYFRVGDDNHHCQDFSAITLPGT